MNDFSVCWKVFLCCHCLKMFTVWLFLDFWRFLKDFQSPSNHFLQDYALLTNRNASIVEYAHSVWIYQLCYNISDFITVIWSIKIMLFYPTLCKERCSTRRCLKVMNKWVSLKDITKFAKIQRSQIKKSIFQYFLPKSVITVTTN